MLGHETILKTGRIYNLEIACDALKKAGVPFVKQEENYTGLKTGYVQPTMGPGNYFNLLVAPSQKETAIIILSELPIDLTTEPNLWHYGADEKSKNNWKVYALVDEPRFVF